MLPKIYTNTKIYFQAHKKIVVAAGLGVLAVAWGGYRVFGTPVQPTKYVLAAVEKGTVITTISGSGQISASNQVDIKAKGSGDVTRINVRVGQKITTSTVIAQLNGKDALKSVRDAAANYESARLSLEKTKQGSTELTLTQAENAVTSARTAIEKLQLSQKTNLEKAEETKKDNETALTDAYQDAYNEIADTFLDLPDIMSSVYDVLSGNTIGNAEPTLGLSGQSNDVALTNSISALHLDMRNTVAGYILSAKSSYSAAKSGYTANLENYKNTNRSASNDTIEILLQKTLDTTKKIGDTIKEEVNILDVWTEHRTTQGQTIFSSVRTYQSNLASYSSTINSHVSALLNIQKTLRSSKQAIVNANRDITEMNQNNPFDIVAAQASLKEKELSLENLKKGADPLDIRSQQLSLQQRANALFDARETLADYTVRAPFAGTIATLDIKPRGTVASGGAVATLITDQRIAEITLNEVDVAKVAVGQKATLTFDAVEDLQISGLVGEINAIGAATQGVVSYGVKILFDTQDERIKPGMSASAAIVTAVKTDVLVVPNSAIKIQGTTSYVEVLANIPLDETAQSNAGIASEITPERVMVEVGLVSDTNTEIISGLAVGDAIIVRTIVPAVTAAKNTTAPSLLGNTGARGAGALTGTGGNTRFQTR